MSKTIISEGKTTAEAVDNGLKELKVSKDMVTIKVIESDDKRSFFSILAPRVVKVELTVKEEGIKKEHKKEVKNETVIEKVEEHYENRKIDENNEEVKVVINKLEEFLNNFINKLPSENIKYKLEVKEYYILVDITGENLNYLIGYRGDTLNALQVILMSIASKYSKEKVRILVDIENYRTKREKALEDLAEKIAKTVIRTNKQVTLEPMSSYERKIIHSKLQENEKVKTFSIGQEPYRKIVVAPK